MPNLAQIEVINTESLCKKALTESDIELLCIAPELVVFLIVRSICEAVKLSHKDYELGNMPKAIMQRNMAKIFESMDTAVDFTARFDIVLPVVDDAEYAKSFWRWYNWWLDYHKKLSDTDRKFLSRMIRAKKYAPVLKYRPDGDWIHYRSKPSFTAKFD